MPVPQPPQAADAAARLFGALAAAAPVPLPAGRRVRVLGSLFTPVVSADAFYIGRPGPHLPGSPFQNHHVVSACCRECRQPHNQVEAVAAFAWDLERNPELVEAARLTLAGRDLACWCRPESGPCHGDVLRLVAIGVDPLAACLAAVAEHQGDHASAALLARVSHALDIVPGPPTAVDGDCRIWEPLVREVARRAGASVALGRVSGWFDAQAQLMVFLHEVTVITVAGGRVVVDLTAQQFSPLLPRRWFADDRGYTERLAQATRCARVDITLAAP